MVDFPFLCLITGGYMYMKNVVHDSNFYDRIAKALRLLTSMNTTKVNKIQKYPKV